MPSQSPIPEIEKIYGRIPLAKKMKVQISRLNSREARLFCPAPPSQNHEGIAFGGAIFSLGALCGWTKLYELGRAPTSPRILLRSAKVDYYEPLTGDFYAQCLLSPRQVRLIRDKLKRGRRFSVRLTVSVGALKRKPAACFSGRYFFLPNF